MKLKYYLRGLGVGILFAALIFSFIIIPKKTKISDDEIKKRAAELGMVEANKQTIPKNTSTPTPTNTGTAAPTPTASGTPTPAASDTPTPTASVTATNSPTPTKAPTNTPAPTLTNTPTPVPTKAPTATPTVTPTNKPTATPTPTATTAPTSTPVPTPTGGAAQNTPSPAPNGDTIAFTVVSGMTSEQISLRLQQLGLIDDAGTFNSYIINNGYENKLKVGTYYLAKGLTYEIICKKISGLIY